ncbi:hypothetical protein [Gracilibacillus oryzae]|uniref:hypothetical protein n=1 Tax=Gracilibacillus oryzae TaxID=1672701 RepID=UPI001295B24F|nr:hypothetical protein [Gracilibacillus oryzae]
MKFSQKQQKSLFSSHHGPHQLHQFSEFRVRDYQTEIADQIGITIHSTQKMKKMQKPT